MKISLLGNMSRLKKKLLLYFFLIAIVSISISVETIIEISSSKLENELKSNFSSHLQELLNQNNPSGILKKIDYNYVFEPIYKLRNRMILFLLFISVSMVAAFILFTRDIVSPLDNIVDATKQIAAGDLTVTVPVVSSDEIGLIAGLINDINKNLTDMINEVRREMNRYKISLIDIHDSLSRAVTEEEYGKMFSEKKIRTSRLKEIINPGQDAVNQLTKIIDDLFELQKYLSMYKTYSINQELSQTEIDKAVIDYDNKNKI